MNKVSLRASVVGIVALGSAACASGPKAPFDVMKNANVTAFRLQNYEPPPPPPSASPTAPAQPGVIPGLPPEIQQWAQQALPGLQQLIPPGILPPGMLQGQPAQPPAPTPAEQVPRFVDFRILGQAQVMDSELREKLGEIFGNEDNYHSQHQACMYPELGISFTPPAGAPRYDLLVSFSCNQVNAVNFAWPHNAAGMTPGMVEALSEVVPQIFAQGAWPAPAPAPGQPVGGQFSVGTGQ